MGHTAQRKWWNAKSQYNGKLRNQDIYRLLARYAQDKLQIYEKEAKTEADAKLATKDDFDAVQFITSASNLRAHNFSIPMESFFKIKEMAGKIVPAISSSNALAASL